MTRDDLLKMVSESGIKVHRFAIADRDHALDHLQTAIEGDFKMLERLAVKIAEHAIREERDAVSDGLDATFLYEVRQGESQALCNMVDDISRMVNRSEP